MHFPLCKLCFSLKKCVLVWRMSYLLHQPLPSRSTSCLSSLWPPLLLLSSFHPMLQLPSFPCCFLSMWQLSMNVTVHMCAPLLGAASCSPYFCKVFVPKSLSVADDHVILRTCLHEHLLDHFMLAVYLIHGWLCESQDLLVWTSSRPL